MRVGLIALGGLRVRTPELAAMGVTFPQFLARGEVVASMPSLGLLTVAGLTPPDVEVAYIEIDALPDDGDLETYDLVAISSFTARIDAAYRLADRYREAGVPVVLGGLHVSALPDEAQAHADSIVVNGAEDAWPRLIADFRAGALRPRYTGRRTRVFEPPYYAPPRFDLLAGRRHDRLTVQTSRGCPIDCAFCAASLRITRHFQQKPVDLAIAEIRAAMAVAEHPFLELADDNTFVNRKWGKAFLRALRELDLRWFTETDISVAEDDELLDLLAESGCRQVLVGLESPSVPSLGGLDPRDWKLRRRESYLDSIARIQARGVAVNGCFVVGHDGDTPDIFEQIRDFVRESGLLDVQVTVLTPFPGTPLYERLRREKRLFRERFWDRCTLFDLNFYPLGMSVDELEDGLRWLYAELYSDADFARRRRSFMEITKRRAKGPACGSGTPVIGRHAS